VNQKTDLLPTNYIEELRIAIHDTDCDPGIIRKILGGRSIAKDVEDGNKIRQIVWPALLGVAKREMKDMGEPTDSEVEKLFKDLGIDEKSIPGNLN
jgi:hypothetical protein